jgi:hypothetical protein
MTEAYAYGLDSTYAVAASFGLFVEDRRGVRTPALTTTKV